MMFALDALQRRLQSFNQFSARRMLDDGESVVADPVGMGLNLGVLSMLRSRNPYRRVFVARTGAHFA